MIRSKFRCLIAFLLLLLLVQACTENSGPGVIPEGEEGVEETSGTLRVMTYNIRYNNPEDGINAWPNRKERVAEMIGPRHQADLAGLQEVLREQIDDLDALLPDYGWIGAGRDDGEDAGEFSPIFYRTERFDLLESETFWLSETPDVPGSRSWDAAITRVVTRGIFRDRRTGREFHHFNTHFDHRGEQARIESAKILLQRVMEVPGESPVIVTGDLNFRETTEGYQILVGDHPTFEVSSDLLDTRYATLTEPQGPDTTSNSWEELRPDTRIDYIFVRQGIEVLSHRTLDDRYEGRFPSDHLPVLVEVRLGQAGSSAASSSQ